MLSELYIEALLVDEELADQVWETWDKGEIDDQVAWLGWWLIAYTQKKEFQNTTCLVHILGNDDEGIDHIITNNHSCWCRLFSL
jgi:hypothetical protein